MMSDAAFLNRNSSFQFKNHFQSGSPSRTAFEGKPSSKAFDPLPQSMYSHAVALCGLCSCTIRPPGIMHGYRHGPCADATLDLLAVAARMAIGVVEAFLNEAKETGLY